MPIDPFSSIAGLMTIIQMTVAASEQAKSHKHNVAALARRIKMLVPLLEEVKERQMTEAQKSNFEDLQLAIERARDLIVKCKDRSKMYMMFRGTGIIERFKDVSLDLDRCLNALPLVNLKVSEEIRQQVDTVSTQLRKAKYTIDEMDQKLSMDIALVLKEQREGLEANQALMRQLAEKLELTSHDKVAAETRALEIEKEEVRAEKNRQEEAYISQIINLLSVMDATQEAGPSGTQEEPLPLEARPSLRMTSPPIAPEEFKCPLSLELMADPVVIASGQTFERAYIRRWWSQGHRTCPITNLPLGNLELISNFSLKRMISDWCDAHNQPQPVPPVLSPPHSPTLRFMTEEGPFGKASEDVASQVTWSATTKFGSRTSEADADEEKWSKSGPMTVPDRGKGGDVGDAGKGKGKQVVTLADMEGAGVHKAGFEHLREGPTAIAYEQHERLPSEFGRVSIHDEEVVTGEVRPGHANPVFGPSSAGQKPLSRRTIRASVPGTESVRASVSGAERSSEEGAHHGRESGWGGHQSVSSEHKPPKPVAAAGKGDPSVPGHRRNSSAPLSELSSGEAARVMNLQAFPANPPSELQNTTPSLYRNHTVADPTRFQARSELWSEALADAFPDCSHHSLRNIRSSPCVSNLASEDAAKSCPPQAQPEEPGNHGAPLSTPPQKRSAHRPPRRCISAHPTPIPSQVAASHVQPYRGEDTEDLSGLNFPPPPPPNSALPRPSSASNLERNVAYSKSLPTKGGVGAREVGGHAAAAAHDAHDHAPPRFAPPSPIHSEVPVAVTHGGHTVRQDSLIPHQRASSADFREPLADPKRPVTAGELQSMARELKSGKPDLIRAAAGDLRLLAKFSMENRKAIAAAGIVPDLVGLLLSKDPKTQENAVTALLNLSIHDGNKAILAKDGAIPRLVEVLQGGSQEAKENAAATLFSLSVLEECKQQIGAQAGAILGLVGLLRTGSPLGKKDATTALFNLSICHENKSRIVRSGAVGPLIQLMKDPTLQEKVVAVLANLTTVGEGRLAITEASGIKALVQITERGTPRSRENAAAALLQLCINSSRHTAEVYQEGVVPALMSLQQTGTPRAKEKARSLLRHFRDNLQDTVEP